MFHHYAAVIVSKFVILMSGPVLPVILWDQEENRFLVILISFMELFPKF